MLQPFLPLSDSGVIYDSDESFHSDEEEEEDAFLSDTQIQEHKDANSYRLAEITTISEQLQAYLCFQIKENTGPLHHPV